MIYLSLAVVIVGVLAWDVARRSVEYRTRCLDQRLQETYATVEALSRDVQEALARVHQCETACNELLKFNETRSTQDDFAKFKDEQHAFLKRIHGEIQDFAQKSEERFQQIETTLSEKAFSRKTTGLYGR